MTSNADDPSEASDEMLRTFLRAQRESVLAIVEGLSEEAWHRSVVPTGWTPAGIVWRGYEDRWELLGTPTPEVPVLLPPRLRELAPDERTGLPNGNPRNDHPPTR
jgi:hypothetical protein